MGEGRNGGGEVDSKSMTSRVWYDVDRVYRATPRIAVELQVRYSQHTEFLDVPGGGGKGRIHSLDTFNCFYVDPRFSVSSRLVAIFQYGYFVCAGDDKFRRRSPPAKRPNTSDAISLARGWESVVRVVHEESGPAKSRAATNKERCEKALTDL